jgi:hypothetical protein
MRNSSIVELGKADHPENRFLSHVRESWSRDLSLGKVEDLDKYTRRVSVDVNRVAMIYDIAASTRTIVCSKEPEVAKYTMKYSLHGWTAFGPSKEEFFDSLQEKRVSQVDKSETALLRASHSRLVQIPTVQMALSPLRAILIFVDHHGAVRTEQLRSLGKSADQIGRYIHILTTLDYLVKEDGKLVAGPKFISRSDKIDAVKVYDEMLARVAFEGYTFLRQVLRFSMMVGYMRWANSYYLTALGAQNKITIPTEFLESRYRTYYGSFDRGELNREAQMQRVVDSGLMIRHDNGITGDDEITPKYFDFAKQLHLGVVA